MKVVLGIDGGGTRTRASIANGEKVLAFAETYEGARADLKNVMASA